MDKHAGAVLGDGSRNGEKRVFVDEVHIGCLYLPFLWVVLDYAVAIDPDEVNVELNHRCYSISHQRVEVIPRHLCLTEIQILFVEGILASFVSPTCGQGTHISHVACSSPRVGHVRVRCSRSQVPGAAASCLPRAGTDSVLPHTKIPSAAVYQMLLCWKCHWMVRAAAEA